jgi:lysozyme family protein
MTALPRDIQTPHPPRGAWRRARAHSIRNQTGTPMAASTFDDALRCLLIHEGGYTNHPSDPGGPTKFGITLGDYRRYVKAGATAADVRAMTIVEAKTIYRERYWNAMRCDELPAGVDYAVFDYAVNSGVSRAAKVLQRLLGFADNGRIGDALLAAVRKRDAADLIARLCDERLAFLQRLKTWPVFGAGWSRRVKEVRAAALAMAKAASPTN